MRSPGAKADSASNALSRLIAFGFQLTNVVSGAQTPVMQQRPTRGSIRGGDRAVGQSVVTPT